MRQAGFEGPFSGGKHQFMKRGALTLPIPNPHHKDIGRRLLAELLAEANIPKTDWEEL